MADYVIFLYTIALSCVSVFFGYMFFFFDFHSIANSHCLIGLFVRALILLYIQSRSYVVIHSLHMKHFPQCSNLRYTICRI